jgi:hypothetical protein
MILNDGTMSNESIAELVTKEAIRVMQTMVEDCEFLQFYKDGPAVAVQTCEGHINVYPQVTIKLTKEIEQLREENKKLRDIIVKARADLVDWN